MEARPMVKNAARIRQTARKVGVDLDKTDVPTPSPPVEEQEQPDIM